MYTMIPRMMFLDAEAWQCVPCSPGIAETSLAALCITRASTRPPIGPRPNGNGVRVAVEYMGSVATEGHAEKRAKKEGRRSKKHTSDCTDTCGIDHRRYIPGSSNYNNFCLCAIFYGCRGRNLSQLEDPGMDALNNVS